MPVILPVYVWFKMIINKVQVVKISQMTKEKISSDIRPLAVYFIQ